jgi:hypothetical protein
MSLGDGLERMVLRFLILVAKTPACAARLNLVCFHRMDTHHESVYRPCLAFPLENKFLTPLGATRLPYCFSF